MGRVIRAPHEAEDQKRMTSASTARTQIDIIAGPRLDRFPRAISAVGPGIVFMLGSLGSRNFVANAMAGASQGTSFIWILVMAALVRVAILEASSRYALVTGESMVAGFGRYFRPAAYL